MAATLTATPLPDEGAIRLVLTAPGPDWELVQLVRTDANGTRAVRLLDGAGLTGGTLIHTDAEAALTGPVTYSATVSDPERTNLVLNASFETNVAGWVAGAGTLSSYNASSPLWWAGYPGIARGVRSVLATADGTSPYLTISQAASDQFALTPGKWVGIHALISGDGVAATGSARCRVDVALYGTGATQYRTSGTFESSTFYNGRQVIYVFQVPPDVSGGRVRVQAYSGSTVTDLAAGQRLWADAIMAVQADSESDALAAVSGPFFEGTVTDVQETVTTSVDVTGEFTRAVVGPVVIPEQAVTLDPVGIETYTAQRSTSGTVTDVIGRGDPVVSLGVQRTRRGRMTLWCRDYAQALAVEAAYGRGKVMLLRQPDFPGMDMYHVVDPIGGTSVDPYDVNSSTRRWSVSVDFVETAAPLGPLLGAAAWTLADSLARNPTLLASQAEFPTLLDLAIGPTS